MNAQENYKQHEVEFNRRSKAENWEVLSQLDNCILKIGDIVTFTNDFGVVFKHHKVLGFRTPTNWGGCVFLDYDCFWFPAKIKNLIKE